VTIFLAHSLGGLVVKQVQQPIEISSDRKAIIEAYNNPDYASLSKDIAAVVFFGTPHQGSDLAGILNLVLTASFASRSFVKQLRPNSDALEAINNSFRHRVEKLKLISFFETENTRLTSVILS
jgi:triacylglycerol esterase/lipase EstA (alpha/beta hydrolase family)